MRHVHRTVRRGLTLLLGVGMIASCDLLGPDESGPEGPGNIKATVVSPAGAEGSAVIEITGGVDLGTISPENGQAFYEHRGGTTRLVVILDEPGTIRFQIRSEDVSVLPTATLIQVGDGSDQLRGSLSGYSVEMEAVADPKNGWERE